MFKFLVYTDKAGYRHLCEGGVYTDDLALLDRADDYQDNTLEKLERDVAEMNEMTSGGYSAEATVELSLTDWDVISSLAPWQKSPFRVYIAEKIS
jgi:hypothetical protein